MFLNLQWTSPLTTHMGSETLTIVKTIVGHAQHKALILTII